MKEDQKKKPVRKGFWAQLMDKLDGQLENKAKASGCGCSSGKDGKKCC